MKRTDCEWSLGLLQKKKAPGKEGSKLFLLRLLPAKKGRNGNMGLISHHQAVVDAPRRGPLFSNSGIPGIPGNLRK
jgi:hypothetical protein